MSTDRGLQKDRQKEIKVKIQTKNFTNRHRDGQRGYKEKEKDREGEKERDRKKEKRRKRETRGDLQ